ncbi:hypothetical protein SAMN02745166_02217 [Prosthecobacter debontii]|uniref:Uncharacterized protein n=1 Tax=Prosthecobacter debontii TaxID=48467 RepID=A0A1T4XZ91_9BACT|nr:hypothetical protein [Prosthecobacter debontii]SKA94840.1 hypothetical protein SAMN02745166_02217 [Prosthecobacter debontii]
MDPDSQPSSGPPLGGPPPPIPSRALKPDLSPPPLPQRPPAPPPLPLQQDANGHYTAHSVDQVKELLQRQATTTGKNPDGTGRDYVFLPFSPDELNNQEEDLLKMATDKVDTYALRKLAIQLYRAEVQSDPSLTNHDTWTDAEFLQKFNASPQQQAFLQQAAPKSPQLIQYHPPDLLQPDQPRPGPGDTVFITAHGSYDSPLLSTRDGQTTLDAHQLLERMRPYIPETIAKINLESCGGRNQFQSSFSATATLDGTYTGVKVIAYGFETPLSEVGLPQPGPEHDSMLSVSDHPFIGLSLGKHVLVGADQWPQVQEHIKTLNLIIEENIQFQAQKEAALPDSLEWQTAQAGLDSNEQRIRDLCAQMRDLEKPGRDHKAQQIIQPPPELSFLNDLPPLDASLPHGPPPPLPSRDSKPILSHPAPELSPEPDSDALSHSSGPQRTRSNSLRDELQAQNTPNPPRRARSNSVGADYQPQNNQAHGQGQGQGLSNS